MNIAQEIKKRSTFLESPYTPKRIRSTNEEEGIVIDGIFCVRVIGDPTTKG
jgi:hypothetical protein